MYGFRSRSTAEAEKAARNSPALRRRAGIFTLFLFIRNHVPMALARVRRMTALTTGASRTKEYSSRRQAAAGMVTEPLRKRRVAMPAQSSRIWNIPTDQRIHPRSRGQAFKILKRTSHVTIVVDEKN